MIRCWVLGLFSVALLLTWQAMAAQDKITLSAYAKSPVGSVLFLRHALAPGNGDPANFNLADCASQRNLDAVGRRQAATLGELFRQHAVAFYVRHSHIDRRAIASPHFAQHHHFIFANSAVFQI